MSRIDHKNLTNTNVPKAVSTQEQTHEWTAGQKWEWCENVEESKAASYLLNALQVHQHNILNSVNTAW